MSRTPGRRRKTVVKGVISLVNIQAGGKMEFNPSGKAPVKAWNPVISKSSARC